jgi:dTDP-glucose pyrophosphorylase
LSDARPLPLTLVLLAAGAGLRFGGSKQLEPLGPRGELLLEYSIRDALRAGFGKIVLVVRREAQPRFAERLEAAARHVPIQYAFQRDPRGTGHALLSAAAALDGPFAVANADDHYGPASFAALAEALAREDDDADAWMVGFALEQTLSPHGPVARALCRQDDDGLLLELEEHTAVSEGRSLVSMNLWGFRRSFLDALRARFAGFAGEGEFQLPTEVNALIAQAGLRVRVLPTADRWLGMTWPDDRDWVIEELSHGAPVWEDA